MNMDMFEQQAEQHKLHQAPLATRMRPNNLHTFVGQEHLIGRGRVLRKAIESDRVPSVILWEPPGCGKTTLIKLTHKYGEDTVPFPSLMS